MPAVLRAIPPSVPLAVLLCALRAGAGPSPEGPWVLPPGQEDLLRRLLSPPGHPCSLQGIRVHGATIHGTFRCPEGPVEALLRPGEDGGEADRPAWTLDLTPPNRRLSRAHAGALRPLREQVLLQRPAPREPEPPPPPPVEAPPPEYSPEEQARYDEAERLVKEGDCRRALPILEEMARARPISQTLGLMVVCLASDAEKPERVQEEVHQAEAHPDDALAAFRAGVISHYAGHRWAPTREGKRAFYDQAVRFLTRAEGALTEVTRVPLYLAVSLYRLGRQAEAEAAIVRAVALAERTRDADAWYCRAEIRHRKDPAGAVADIETYFQVMEPNIARGAIHSPAKQVRVRRMQERLRRAANGTEPIRPDEDLFDPLPDTLTRLVRGQSPWAAGLLGGLLALAGLWGLRRLARGRRPPAP